MNYTICHICERYYNNPENYKVRNLFHLTVLFRGAACKHSNIIYKTPKYIPLVCHNLSGYDTHFIIKELNLDTELIEIIAQS